MQPRAPLLLVLFAQLAAALHIPASLRRHLQHKLASALTGGAAAEQAPEAAASLLDALVEHTPEEQADAAAWAHTSGTKLARLISANSTAGEELASGCLTVVDALALADARHRRSTDMFEAVQVHHATLRRAVLTSTPGAASASRAWESATADREALQRYGEAAVDVGRRRWARLGIEWCTATAHEFFRGGGAARRARKRAARAHYRATGEALPAEVAQRLESDLAAASQLRQSEPIRLLDVGSCGFLFGEAEGFQCTALDLCPQDPRTFEIWAHQGHDVPQMKETPCDLKALVSDDTPADEGMTAMFMSLVGALAWLVLTIPAICVYVAYLQRHTKAPTMGHVRRGNRLLRWIRRNKARLGVWFQKLRGPLMLMTLSDSAFKA